MKRYLYPIEWEYTKYKHANFRSTCVHWRLFPRLVKLDVYAPSTGYRLWFYVPWGTAFMFSVWVDRR